MLDMCMWFIVEMICWVYFWYLILGRYFLKYLEIFILFCIFCIVIVCIYLKIFNYVYEKGFDKCLDLILVCIINMKIYFLEYGK